MVSNYLGKWVMFSEEDMRLLERLQRMNEEFNKEYRQYERLKSDYNYLKLQFTEVKHTEVPTIELKDLDL